MRDRTDAFLYTIVILFFMMAVSYIQVFHVKQIQTQLDAIEKSLGSPCFNRSIEVSSQ